MALYRIMIVDDEEATRQGLLALPLWASLGIEPMAQADDGDSALACIEQVDAPPDILLTDVKMPRMDGIALGRRALALLPDLKVLFVSGYDDVEYVRSALKMGACDYICKPIDIDELEACLRRTVAGIEKQRALEFRMRALQEKSAHVEPTLRRQLLRGLLSPVMQPDALAKQQAMAGVELSRARYAALCLQLDDYDGAISMLGSATLLELSVQNIAEELLGEACAQVIVAATQSPAQYVALLGADQPMALPPLATRLRDMIVGYLGVGASVGVGTGCQGRRRFSSRSNRRPARLDTGCIWGRTR